MKTLEGLILGAIILLTFLNIPAALGQSKGFIATGPNQPTKHDPEQFRGAVTVEFEMIPTTMSFDLPWTYAMVNQEGVRFSTLAAETYDPRDFDGTGGLASFEPGMDNEGRYVRAWIAHDSEARKVIRIRYALANNLSDIAFPDISKTPYGNGDWVDEWFYIYPDGVHTRHMRIHTGLASVSQPFGFDREPPNVVHEFMELNVQGPPGHKPTDDIEIGALTLIKLLGAHTGIPNEEGESTTISFDPYPEDFGEFRDANIMLMNLTSEYKPFTIGMPYGVRVQPYWPEDELPLVFQTWGYGPNRGYSSSIGHMLNFWHYRRTGNTIEQVYLHGMTNAEDPHEELVSLSWSWITPPKLRMEGLEPDYLQYTYDAAQRAYVIPRKGRGPIDLEFTLEAEDEERDTPGWIINPGFIIKDWDDGGVEVKVNGKALEEGADYRMGYEQTTTGKDLIMWLPLQSNENLEISISPMR